MANFASRRGGTGLLDTADEGYTARRPLIRIYNKYSAVVEMGDRLATIDMGRKKGLLCPFRGGGELDPRLTQCGLG